MKFGFLLYLIASIIKILLAPLAYSYGFIRSISKKETNKYHMRLAIAKDQYGNALCSFLFNDTLIKKNGYKFGNIDETISSVIGKNKELGTLTYLGRILDMILDVFDSNHSLKSIDTTIINSQENKETDNSI